jgi:hypothetical protein
MVGTASARGLIRGAARVEMVCSSRESTGVHPPVNPRSTPVNPSAGAPGIAASYGGFGRLGPGAASGKRGWSVMRSLSRE